MSESFSEVLNKKLHVEKNSPQSDWVEDGVPLSAIPQPIPRKTMGIDPAYTPEVGRSPSRYFESKITSGKQFADEMKAEERTAINEDAEDYQAAGLMINGFFYLARRYGGDNSGCSANDGRQIYQQPGYWQQTYGQPGCGRQNYRQEQPFLNQRNYYGNGAQSVYEQQSLNNQGQNYWNNQTFRSGQLGGMNGGFVPSMRRNYVLPPGIRPGQRNSY